MNTVAILLLALMGCALIKAASLNAEYSAEYKDVQRQKRAATTTTTTKPTTTTTTKPTTTTTKPTTKKPKTNPDLCTPGNYHDKKNKTLCYPCPFGQYQPASNQPSCVKCDAGTFSNVTGAKAASTCVNCVAGTFSLPGAASCKQCKAGQTSTAGGTCTNCTAGQTSMTGGECTACARGSCSAAGMTQCIPSNKRCNLDALALVAARVTPSLDEASHNALMDSMFMSLSLANFPCIYGVLLFKSLDDVKSLVDASFRDNGACTPMQ